MFKFTSVPLRTSEKSPYSDGLPLNHPFTVHGSILNRIMMDFNYTRLYTLIWIGTAETHGRLWCARSASLPIFQPLAVAVDVPVTSPDKCWRYILWTRVIFEGCVKSVTLVWWWLGGDVTCPFSMIASSNTKRRICDVQRSNPTRYTAHSIVKHKLCARRERV